jgi:plastocyanin
MRSAAPFTALFSLAVVIVAGGALVVAPPAAQPSTLHVIAGQGEGFIHMNGFVPENVRVAVGTTVTWTIGSDEAATHMARYHDWQIADILATRSRATRFDGPNGTSIWFVRAGTDWRRGHLDVQMFLPEQLTVRQGIP